MLEVKGPWGGQGDLTWAMWRLRRCVPEAGRLEERDNMCEKGVGRGLRLSGEQRGAQLTLILQGTQNKEACGLDASDREERGKPGRPRVTPRFLELELQARDRV